LKLNGTHQLLVYADVLMYCTEAYILQKKHRNFSSC